MRKSKKKLPNAQKHGAFANTAILPGEHRHEFEKLHSDLIKEWNPVGPTEQDAVLSIANGIWRKRRVQRFLLAEIAKAKFDPKNAAYDLADHLMIFAGLVAHSPDNAFRVYAHLLPDEQINHFKMKFPRESYESLSQWAEAIVKEIISMLPQYVELRNLQLPEEFLAITSSATLSHDLFKNEMALDERLDAMIDRATKRLIQAKAMKQMLGQNSQSGVRHSVSTAAPDRQIAAR